MSAKQFCSADAPPLWDRNTFAHSYEPANPANLRLFYSDEKRDVLVQYDEARDGAAPSRHRNYYADQNAERVNNHRRPHFTSIPDQQNLHQIPITNAPAARPQKQQHHSRVFTRQLLRNTLGNFFCLRELETERCRRFFQVVNQSLPMLLLINLHALADVSIAIL